MQLSLASLNKEIPLGSKCAPQFRRITRRWCHQRGAVCKAKSSESLEMELQRLKKENRELRKRLKELKSKIQVTEEVVEEVPVSPKLPDGEIHWPSPNESPPFWTRSPHLNSHLETNSRANKSIKMKDPLDEKSLYVMHITAEMAPIAKVGGLADVVTGLARASMARGHTIEVCLPFYECLPEAEIENLEKECDLECPKGEIHDGTLQMGSLQTEVWKGKIAGIQVFLIRPNWEQSNLFKADRIYGGGYNELEAYLFFSRACLEFLKVTNRQPHVLHLHEWQTAPVALLYWERFHHDTLTLPRILFTIHNLDSTGECRQDEFSFTGVSGEIFATVDKALDERTIGHNPERLNLLKGALIYSNGVTTVSPTYAREVLDGGAGGWLRGTLGRSDLRSKVSGILNGIDVDDWNPKADIYLPMSFSELSPMGKATCKEYLQKVMCHSSQIYSFKQDLKGLGLEVDPSKPLVSCVTRLVPQKGIHLIKRGVYQTNELGGQFVLLGTGHADGDFRGMAENEFRNHPNIKLMLLYSEALAHLVYAASDIVLVPSMFEPCGLTQMIAMRYGALPLVRKTGGLADTVQDLDESPSGNGFSFDGVDEGELSACLTRAIQLYQTNQERWMSVSLSNMELDFSWDVSVQSYLDLYNSIAAY